MLYSKLLLANKLINYDNNPNYFEKNLILLRYIPSSEHTPGRYFFSGNYSFFFILNGATEPAQNSHYNS